jgi:hypothetical protein
MLGCSLDQRIVQGDCARIVPRGELFSLWAGAGPYRPYGGCPATPYVAIGRKAVPGPTSGPEFTASSRLWWAPGGDRLLRWGRSTVGTLTLRESESYSPSMMPLATARGTLSTTSLVRKGGES